MTSRWLLLCVAILACSDNGSKPGAADRNAIPATSLPIVSDSPTVVIGTVDEDPNYQFVDVVGATRRPDGTIVVADRGTSNLRFYDARGKFLRKVGRNGEGPGEFRMIGEFVPLQNGFLVRDWRLPRTSLLDEKGKVERFVEDPKGPIVEDDNYMKGRSRYVYELLAESPPYIVAYRSYHPSLRSFRFPPNVTFRDTALFVKLSIPKGDPATSQVVDSLGAALGPPVATRMRTIPNGQEIQIARYIDFSPWPEIAVGKDRAYIADSDSLVIRVLDLNGRQIETIRDDREIERVTAEDIAALKQRMMGNNKDEKGQPFAPSETRKWIDWYFSNMPLPKTKPTRSTMRVDGHDNLWVQDFSVLTNVRRTLAKNAPATDGRWWTLFNRDGKKLGRLQMPAGLIVKEIGRDYILGLSIDDLDVQTVVLYKLRNL